MSLLEPKKDEACVSSLPEHRSQPKRDLVRYMKKWAVLDLVGRLVTPQIDLRVAIQERRRNREEEIKELDRYQTRSHRTSLFVNNRALVSIWKGRHCNDDGNIPQAFLTTASLTAFDGYAVIILCCSLSYLKVL